MAKKEMKLGLILNYINMFISSISMIILTPYLISVLGNAEYGLYSLIGAFAGYLQLFDFGIGTATIRYVAKYNAEKDEKGRENFLAISQIIYSILGILIIIVSVILFCSLGTIFSKTVVGEDLVKAKVMFVLLAFNIFTSTVFANHKATIFGCEKFIFPKVVSIIAAVLKIVAIFTILPFFNTAIVLTGITVVLGVISTLLNVYYVKVKLKIKSKLHHWDKPLFKEVLLFSLFNFMQMMMGQLYWKIDEMIVGMMISTTMVTICNVGMQINTFTLNITTAINNFTLPAATRMCVNKASNRQITEFMASTGRIIAFLYVPIMIGFGFFGKDFIILWAGKDNVLAYYVAVIVIGCAMITRIQGTANDIMKAKNMHGFLTTIYFIAAIMNVGLTVIGIKLWGVLGASIATGITLLIANTLIANIYFQKKVGINVKYFFKCILKGFLIVSILCSMLCWILNALIPQIGWGSLLIKCCIFGAVYVVLMYIMGANKEEKNKINQILYRITKLKAFKQKEA